MTELHAEWALTPQGWQTQVRLGIERGRFVSVEPGQPPAPGAERVRVLLPALGNVHSHAFQRAMAGLTERRGPGADNFWSWREAMYRFLARMTPDDVEAVAALLYVEMLEAGFGRVGEFHYLHHGPDGRPYAHLAEMAERVAAAAAQTGIGLTLLPCYYRWSDFGAAPPTAGQLRFITEPDQFARLVEQCRAVAAVVGVAPHSLRAVGPSDLEFAAALAGSGPIHLHAAEQVREVEACVAWSGARPVEWLLDHAGLGRRWCLIHATHMTAEETMRLARSGTVAGLCPVTEANLGDGVFPAASFRAAGGAFAVGTDSNVLIGAADELRQLEYAQRLVLRARNVLADAGASTGRTLFEAALAGGAQALGAGQAELAPGAPADCLALDPEHPALVGRERDALLDSWIFAAGSRAVDRVWVRGKSVVIGGRHVGREPIQRRFAATVRRLAA